jgi:sugar phosphate isomerase/epimerase
MNRRDFIKKTSVMSSVLMANETFAKPNFSIPADFKLTMLATNWGFPGSIDDFAKKAKEEGYDGVELWLPDQQKDRDAMMNALSKNGLKYGFLYGAGQKDFKENYDSFEKMLTIGLALKPMFFNSHSGKDFFTADQAKVFFDLTIKKSKETGIPIYHETHRGRLCFAAHITRDFIKNNPNLRLTLDISHWCNVHESLLENQAETVALALAHTDHIHARVGHPEGPQVNDPRAPEWKAALDTHLGWWDKVVEEKAKTTKQLTILAEFGPVDYMPALPYTRQPLADQWGINVYMMKMLRERYKGK